MTAEHLKPMLDSGVDIQHLYEHSRRMMEESEALSSETSFGVWSRTIAKQFSKQGEAATAPFHFALSTRTGCECVTHLIRGATDVNDRTTIVSVDGIGAFDSISRNSMFSGLQRMVGGDQMIPFVGLCYGSPSVYLWEDDMGETHEIFQGEGGEQGDPLMPLLFSLEQHRALLAVNARLVEGESVFAFLDDLYVLCSPERVGEVHKVIQQELWSRANIRVHHGKTKVWNRAGAEPRGCAELTAAARMVKENATVWVGDRSLPSAAQGKRVLGSLIGHPDFVRSFLEKKTAEHSVLLERIPAVPDLQSAWLLLLFCAAPRSKIWLRTVQPELVDAFATAHDVGLWQCLCAILHVNGDMVTASAKETASVPLSMGGLGLWSAFRSRQASHWASWCDCLELIRDRFFQGWGMLMDRLTSTQQEHPPQHRSSQRVCSLS